MRAFFVGVRDDGHTRYRFVFRGTNGERIDIDGQAPRERSDAIQHPWFIFDISDNGLHVPSLQTTSLRFLYGSVAVSTSGLLGRRIMSLSEAPAATMGYTESSCSTRKSNKVVSLEARAARMAGATSARLEMRSPRMPNALASAAKSGAT